MSKQHDQQQDQQQQQQQLAVGYWRARRQLMRPRLCSLVRSTGGSRRQQIEIQQKLVFAAQ